MFPSLLQREAGSGTPRKPASVRSACSIALAHRLERIGTLDGHDGCVNTVVRPPTHWPRLMSAHSGVAWDEPAGRPSDFHCRCTQYRVTVIKHGSSLGVPQGCVLSRGDR